MRRESLGWVIFFLGSMYGVVTTAYFGGNFFPQTDAECVVDGIAILICRDVGRVADGVQADGRNHGGHR